jgi:uncharacterized membrane protein
MPAMINGENLLEAVIVGAVAVVALCLAAALFRPTVDRSLAVGAEDADRELAMLQAYLDGRADERRENADLYGWRGLRPQDVHPSAWDWGGTG